VKVLTKYYGFSVERQSGSHIQLKHPDVRRVTVPRTTDRPIKQGVMKSIISQAHTTQEEFLTHF
jgi:predicted RNA binding protein YcfA (HicA-like mRNA interferase family)